MHFACETDMNYWVPESRLWWLNSGYLRTFCILFPRVCEYVALHGKRDFADLIKLKMLGILILDYPGGSNIITRFLVRGMSD